MPNTNSITPTIYHFEGQEIRIILKHDNTPWWVLADVCKACDIKNSRNVVNRLEADQKGVHTIDTLGGPQKVTIINESGLYDVILDSKKPEARKFRKWVTGEILPQIRQTGVYMTEQAKQAIINDPDAIIQIATQWKAERAAREEAEARVAELEPKADAYEAFTNIPDVMLVRDAAKALTSVGIAIKERELFEWLDAHKWTYHTADNSRRAYADRIQAGHLVQVMAKTVGQHRDGTPFTYPPTVKITRNGLMLIYRNLVDQQLPALFRVTV